MTWAESPAEGESAQKDRRHADGTIDMRSQKPAVLMLLAAAALMLGGFVGHLMAAGQQPPYPATQDGINALLWAQMDALAARQSAIEGMLKVGLGAIFMNIGAHLFQIWTIRKPRDKD